MAQLHPMTTVRLAQPDDIPYLEAIERSAATLFTSIPSTAHHVHDPPMDPARLTSFMSHGHLWVAVSSSQSSSTAPVAFLTGYPLDETSFYIAELSVAASHQRMGIGSLLLETMCAAVLSEGFKEVVLVTYREVPWNGPWYKKQRFVDVENVNPGSQLEKVLEEEKEGLEFEKGSRCAMRRKLNG